MALGIYIPDRVEGEPEIEIERGMRSRDEIERLQWQFRRPAYNDDHIAELAAEYAEGEAKEAING